MGCKMEASNGQSDVLRSRNASENVYRPSCGRLQGLAFGYVGSDCILNVADPCFDWTGLHWERSGSINWHYSTYYILSQIYIYKLNSCCSTFFTVQSFVELVCYLFKVPGVSCFLSEGLSQDPLEKFFGCQRQRGGAGDNPSVADFCKNTQVLWVINTTCANVPRGNCRGSTDMPDLEKENNPSLRDVAHKNSITLLCTDIIINVQLLNSVK